MRKKSKQKLAKVIEVIRRVETRGSETANKRVGKKGLKGQGKVLRGLRGLSISIN